MADDPYVRPRGERSAPGQRGPGGDEAERRRNRIGWFLAIPSVLLIGAGQLFYQAGEHAALGTALIAVGGLALAVVIARVALAGLPKKRKR